MATVPPDLLTPALTRLGSQLWSLLCLSYSSPVLVSVSVSVRVCDVVAGEYVAGGVTYVGAWQRGAMHGKGVMRWASGDRYTGDWRDGVQSIFPPFLILSIVFSNSYPRLRLCCAAGRGRLVYADGSVYVGEWERGHPHGFGVTAYPNGERYVGAMQRGLRTGPPPLLLRL